MAGQGPWDQHHGMQRLRWLDFLPATQGPNDIDLGPEPSTSEFLSALRGYAVQAVDAEFLEERQKVWEILGDHGPEDHPNPPGDWWTLSTSADLQEYRTLLMRDLRCDPDSCGYFVRLVRTGKPEAFMEALRILHHLIKDKDNARTLQDPQGVSGEQNSKWLKNACMEAMDALAAPEVWEQGPANNAKGASKGSWSSFNPFGPDEHGQDYGKGKGIKGELTGAMMALKGSSRSSNDGTHSRQGWRG